MMSNEKEIDLSLLNDLSEEERQVALEILKQYAETGTSELFEELKYADFEEIPVDITTFLHDPLYLGKGLTDAEGRFTLYPYWENCLKDIFPDNITTKYNNIVFTGAIGLGKSTIAIIAILYMLYRLLCLKDPYQYYGMQPIDKLSISLMNITLENAKGVALDKMNQMILSSDWFLAHGEMTGTSNLIYRPEKHIEVVLASSNNQIIGRAIFANFTDEVNFGLVANPERQKQKMMKLITQLDARMKSRFMRGTYLPTLNIIASSKDTEQSFLEEYIKNKEENNSTTTLVVDEPQWIVDSRKDSEEKFWVAVGNKMLPNELPPPNITEVEVDELRKKGYDMWQVPIGYLETFQLNLDEAICSIIGIATASSLKYIAGHKLAETKTAVYRNPFVKDVIEVGDGKEDFLQYANFFDLSTISEEDKARPLFIHLDMSGGTSGKGGDKTGIAGIWITGKERHTKLLQTDINTYEPSVTDQELMNDLHYKLAFSVSIKAPKGENISYAKNKIFIRWLKEQGFAIKCVSMDTYQSSAVAQELSGEGFKTEITTVDRVQKDAVGRPVCLPYHFLKSMINERQITIYDKCDQLTDELINLERKGDGHIDHPKHGGKDQADAVCGALWNASKFSEEYSYSYGDSITATLDANDFSLNTEYSKQKMVADFQEELAKIYAETAAAETEQQRKAKEEYEYYQDLQDGIIII